MALDIAKILSSLSNANILNSYPGRVPIHLNYVNLDKFPGIPRVQDSFFFADRGSDGWSNVWKWLAELWAMNSNLFPLFLSLLIAQGCLNIGGKHCTTWCSSWIILEAVSQTGTDVKILQVHHRWYTHGRSSSHGFWQRSSERLKTFSDIHIRHLMIWRIYRGSLRNYLQVVK